MDTGMKPVTDPDLIAELEGNAPAKSKAVTDPALLAQLESGVDPKAAADMKRMADPTSGMPWYEKAAVGAGSAVAKAGEGVLDLANKAGLIDKGKQADLAQMKEDRGLYKQHHPGGWATA